MKVIFPVFKKGYFPAYIFFLCSVAKQWQEGERARQNAGGGQRQSDRLQGCQSTRTWRPTHKPLCLSFPPGNGNGNGIGMWKVQKWVRWGGGGWGGGRGGEKKAAEAWPVNTPSASWRCCVWWRFDFPLFFVFVFCFFPSGTYGDLRATCPARATWFACFPPVACVIDAHALNPTAVTLFLGPRIPPRNGNKTNLWICHCKHEKKNRELLYTFLAAKIITQNIPCLCMFLVV